MHEKKVVVHFLMQSTSFAYTYPILPIRLFDILHQFHLHSKDDRHISAVRKVIVCYYLPLKSPKMTGWHGKIEVTSVSRLVSKKKESVSFKPKKREILVQIKCKIIHGVYKVHFFCHPCGISTWITLVMTLNPPPSYHNNRPYIRHLLTVLAFDQGSSLKQNRYMYDRTCCCLCG